MLCLKILNTQLLHKLALLIRILHQFKKNQIIGLGLTIFLVKYTKMLHEKTNTK